MPPRRRTGKRRTLNLRERWALIADPSSIPRTFGSVEAGAEAWQMHRADLLAASGAVPAAVFIYGAPWPVWPPARPLGLDLDRLPDDWQRWVRYWTDEATVEARRVEGVDALADLAEAQRAWLSEHEPALLIRYPRRRTTLTTATNEPKEDGCR